MSTLQQKLLVACLLAAGCATPAEVGARGWTLLESRNYAAALEEFEQALQTRREAELFAGRGQALYRLGRAREARSCFEVACSLEPRTARWQVGLAVVLLELGDEDGCVAACDAALELDPQLATALYDRGCAHLRARRFELALADFTRAIELEPARAEAFDNRGSALLGLGRTDEAIADFQRALRLAPLASAHGNCAAACYAGGDARRALAELNQALRLDSTRPDFFANRGRIYLDLGRSDLARADFEEALARAPASPLYRRLLDEAAGPATPRGTAPPAAPAAALDRGAAR